MTNLEVEFHALMRLIYDRTKSECGCNAPRFLKMIGAKGALRLWTSAAASLLCGHVLAQQYVATPLGPPNAILSEARGISRDGSVQAGNCYFEVGINNYEWHGGRWNRLPFTFSSVPQGGNTTWVQAISADGSTLAGYTRSIPDAPLRATMWTAPGQSVALHPTGLADTSAVFALSATGSRQAGVIEVGSTSRAVMWSGSASSIVILGEGTSGSGSGAYGISGDGSLQCGAVDRSAVVWNSSPNNPIVLAQGSPYFSAFAFGLSHDGARAVGTTNSFEPREAQLWDVPTRTALGLRKPLGWYHTFGMGISPNGRFQVGYGNIQFYTAPSRALLWEGPASDPIDLHLTLGSEYAYSQALAVSDSGDVVGVAHLANPPKDVAMLWRRVATNESGGNTGGDLALRSLRGPSSSSRPLVLVNGLDLNFSASGFLNGFVGGTGGQSQWDTFVSNLSSSHGSEGFTPNTPGNPDGLIFVCDTIDSSKPLWWNAVKLNEYIESIRNTPPFTRSGQKFDIVGYSMGGLIAREWEQFYDRNTADNAYSANTKRLRNLVTFSTPHGGSPVADLVVLLFSRGLIGALLCPPSVYEFTTPVTFLYNKFAKGFPGVRYSRLAADVNSWWPLFGSHHDTVVKVSSQQSSSWIGSGFTGDTKSLPGLCHAGFSLLPWQDVRDAPQTATAVYEAIYGGGGGLGPEDQEQTEPETRGSLTSQATLNRNAALNRYVSVPGGAGTLGLSTSWADGDASFVAVEPGGRVIDPTVSAADPKIEYAKEGNNASYAIQSPKAGLWTLRISGAANIPANGTQCRLSAADQAPIEAKPLSPIVVRANGSARFQVSLEDGIGKLTGGVVEATLTNPSGTTSNLAFFDDGLHADGGAYDGLFASAQVTASAPGSYVVQGRITGSKGYGTACRLFSTSFDGSPESGRILGISAVAATDDPDDSDTYFDLLRVSVKQNFAATGTYILSGELIGPQGQFIDQVTEVVEPTATGQLITQLKFRGQVIGEVMLDGPYTVRNVRLTDQNGDRSVLTDYKATIGTTAAYSKLQFETITARTASPANHFDGSSLISIPLDIADPAVTIKTILGPNVTFPGPWQGNRLRGTSIKVAWKGPKPAIATYLGSEDDYEFPIVFEKAGAQTVGCPYNRPLPINRFYVRNVTTGEVRTSTVDAASTSPWVSWSFGYQQGGVWKLAKLSGGNETKLRPWFGYRFATNVPNLEITFRD